MNRVEDLTREWQRLAKKLKVLEDRLPDALREACYKYERARVAHDFMEMLRRYVSHEQLERSGVLSRGEWFCQRLDRLATEGDGRYQRIRTKIDELRVEVDIARTNRTLALDEHARAAEVARVAEQLDEHEKRAKP